MIGTVSHCDWRALAERVRSEVGQVDALICDPPYSERTHGGHDAGTRGDGHHDPNYGHRMVTRQIEYPSWSTQEVRDFVAAWAPLTRGWMVAMTDHVLAPAWLSAMEDAGRCGFAPLPLVEIGSRVRLAGDGPSSWTTWLVVSRPRNVVMRAWGTIRGAYVLTGRGDRVIIGGKRTDAMEALAEDYSRPGDIVCDPCCGAGTTLLAAQLTGRRYIGGDIDASHVAIAEERLRALPTTDRKGTLPLPWEAA